VRLGCSHLRSLCVREVAESDRGILQEYGAEMASNDIARIDISKNHRNTSKIEIGEISNEHRDHDLCFLCFLIRVV
jgi:hypothetical protein